MIYMMYIFTWLLSMILSLFYENVNNKKMQYIGYLGEQYV